MWSASRTWASPRHEGLAERYLSTGPPAGFTDVNADSVHYANINALAESGVTQGCATDEFCPRRDTTRAQMTFLHRGSRMDTATVAARPRSRGPRRPRWPMAGYEVQRPAARAGT